MTLCRGTTAHAGSHLLYNAAARYHKLQYVASSCLTLLLPCPTPSWLRHKVLTLALEHGAWHWHWDGTVHTGIAHRTICYPLLI